MLSATRDGTIQWELLPVSAFPRYAADWDALNARSFNSLLLRARFYSHLLAAFGDGSETLAIGRCAGDVVACGIFVRAGRASWQTFQPSQAPLGAWLFDAAAVPLGAALHGLQLALPGVCLVLGITQQDPDHCDRPADTRHLRTLDYIETARISAPESFALYWSQRGRNLRQNLKRQRNSLAKLAIETRLEVVEDPAAMLACVKDYGAMESMGWKAQEGTAITIDNDQGQFYSRMLKDFAETGNAAVCRYFYNEKLVATDLCVLDDNELIILKTTHDESEAKTSPAFLMRQDYFERCFDTSRTSRVEFYGKLMNWHTKWSNEVRRMYHVNRYRWPVLAALLAR